MFSLVNISILKVHRVAKIQTGCNIVYDFRGKTWLLTYCKRITIMLKY